MPTTRHQLRVYNVKPGRTDEFVEGWKEHFVPTRLELGFTVAGAWTVPATGEFIWIPQWNGAGSYEDGEKAYYESPQRQAVTWSPREILNSVDTKVMAPVPGFEPRG
jgi:hypothetical protein